MAQKQELSYASFLQSDTVSLKSAKSERAFNMHRDLLASKSKAIISAFENGFKETETGIYEFEDVSEETLAYFIQWAYTGDYPALIYEPPSTDSLNNPLPPQLALYVFCNIYLVPDLKSIVFGRVVAATKLLDAPWRSCSSRILTDMLRYVFSLLLADDPVLEMLVQFAAYRIAELRQDDDFLELIRDLPAFEARLLGLLIGPKSPPWAAPIAIDFEYTWRPRSRHSKDI
ncbi:hypothetical protein BJX99DRAFT_238031 [Aspergillus californicus]